MITVSEALEIVKNAARPLPSRHVKLGEALGLRLGESIISSIDSPPFDKSLLDGYAVAASDPSPTRRVIEQVIAGGVPHHAVEPGITINVMTGAPIPDGADAIVKHEDVRQEDAQHVDGQPVGEPTIQLPKSGVTAGSGILHRGAAFHVGQQVLTAGRCLSAIDIALLAEVGRPEVIVTPRPRVAVLPTGNELVECGQPVGAGQICNSNGPMLLALLESMRASPIDLGIGRDDPKVLRQLIEQGLDADVLLVTGGVSAGVMDLVPAALDDLGVRELFHKVRMKPGKPVWFGHYQQEGKSTLVFGMPGNPVSTLVSFEVFVKPVLRVLGGGTFVPPQSQRGRLIGPIGHRGNRPTYYPSQIHADSRAHGSQQHASQDPGLPAVETLPWRGSADLAALTGANALTILPAGDYELSAGTEVDFLPL